MPRKSKPDLGRSLLRKQVSKRTVEMQNSSCKTGFRIFTRVLIRVRTPNSLSISHPSLTPDSLKYSEKNRVHTFVIFKKDLGRKLCLQGGLAPWRIHVCWRKIGYPAIAAKLLSPSWQISTCPGRIGKTRHHTRNWYTKPRSQTTL